MSDNRIAEVTQADRDAFIDYEKNTSIGLNPTFCAAIRAGDHDADRRIQAFARHREAHRTAASQASDVRTALEKCIALIDDMSRFVGQMSLKDYALFNEAPMLAQKALATLTAPPTSGEEMRLRDWHPIASAPKNRPILVIGLPPLWKGYPFVVRWDATLEGGEGWWRHMDPSLDALYSVSDSITHWSDYPVLPAVLKGAE